MKDAYKSCGKPLSEDKLKEYTEAVVSIDLEIHYVADIFKNGESIHIVAIFRFCQTVHSKNEQPLRALKYPVWRIFAIEPSKRVPGTQRTK